MFDYEKEKDDTKQTDDTKVEWVVSDPVVHFSIP